MLGWGNGIKKKETKAVSSCSRLGIKSMYIYLILIRVVVVFCHRFITEDVPLTTRPRALTGALLRARACVWGTHNPIPMSAVYLSAITS